MLSTLAAFVLGAAGAAAPPRAPAPVWLSVVEYDEVRVEADTTRVSGAGPYVVWLRWSFLGRASSPSAWDAGVRSSVDRVELDCAGGAARTFSSRAFAAGGDELPGASFDDPSPAWRVPGDGSVGAELVVRVCDLIRTRR